MIRHNLVLSDSLYPKSRKNHLNSQRKAPGAACTDRNAFQCVRKGAPLAEQPDNSSKHADFACPGKREVMSQKEDLLPHTTSNW